MQPTITHQQFMDYFRSDAYALNATADDGVEIFLNALKGSSDLTFKLLDELAENYDYRSIIQVVNQTNPACAHYKQ